MVRKKAPKIYSKDLVAVVFRQPYCKIKFLEDAGIGNRQTASAYLKELDKIGVLQGAKKGRELYYRYRKSDNETAIALFQKALALDASFALAYAGLGDAYAQRVLRFEGNRAIVFEQNDRIPAKELSRCVAMARTHHRAKRRGKAR
jgi:tetratricopeptide (TPR) repeat protein